MSRQTIISSDWVPMPLMPLSCPMCQQHNDVVAVSLERKSRQGYEKAHSQLHFTSQPLITANTARECYVDKAFWADSVITHYTSMWTQLPYENITSDVGWQRQSRAMCFIDFQWLRLKNCLSSWVADQTHGFDKASNLVMTPKQLPTKHTMYTF